MYGNIEHFPTDSIETEINNNLEYSDKWFKLPLNVAKTRLIKKDANAHPNKQYFYIRNNYIYFFV